MIRLRLIGAVVAAILLSIRVLSQPIIHPHDSVSMYLPDITIPEYFTSLPAVKSVLAAYQGPNPVTPLPKEKVQIGAYMFTLLTGVSVSTSSDDLTNWILEHEVRCRDKSLSWKVPTYCLGKKEVKRERIDDTVEKTSVVSADLSLGANGFIIDQQDTIGAFTLSINPDSSQAKLLSNLVNDSKWVVDRYQRVNKRTGGIYAGRDYVITGIFRGRPFTMATSGSISRSVLLVDDQPQIIFQRDPPFITLGKKNRVLPHLLYRTGLTDKEKVDYLRMAMVSVVMNKMMGGL